MGARSLALVLAATVTGVAIGVLVRRTVAELDIAIGNLVLVGFGSVTSGRADGGRYRWSPGFSAVVDPSLGVGCADDHGPGRAQALGEGLAAGLVFAAGPEFGQTTQQAEESLTPYNR